MAREYWKFAVLQGLRDLSDKDFQEKVWLRHEGDVVSTPIEAVNQLFDDTGLGDVLEAGIAFSPIVDEMLKKLSKSIDRVNLSLPIPDLLASEEWREVRTIASQAFEEVKKVIGIDE